MTNIDGQIPFASLPSLEIPDYINTEHPDFPKYFSFCILDGDGNLKSWWERLPGKTNNTADFTVYLQSLEAELQRLIQCREYADIIASKLYIPDMSLVDALHAVQECIHDYAAIRQILDQYPGDSPAWAATQHLAKMRHENLLQLSGIKHD